MNLKTIKQLSYNFPTIKFLTGSEIVVEKLVDCGVEKKNIIILNATPHCWWDLGIMRVKLEKLYHDTPNYALKVAIPKNNEWFKCLYVVDTNRIDHIKNAGGYDLYLIENNYQENLLQQHIENCDDENMLYYLNRVPKTHLSAEQANSFLIENMGSNSVYEYIHQSDYNYKDID